MMKSVLFENNFSSIPLLHAIKTFLELIDVVTVSNYWIKVDTSDNHPEPHSPYFQLAK